MHYVSTYLDTLPRLPVLDSSKQLRNIAPWLQTLVRCGSAGDTDCTTILVFVFASDSYVQHLVFGHFWAETYDHIDSDGELNGCWDEDECGPLAFHEPPYH